MTQSPVIPALMPNLEFMEQYMDSLENLPLDIQRYVSEIREYDLLYSKQLETISRYLLLYQKEESGPSKRTYLNKIQRCLVKSQQYADEKLSLISQIVELVDTRSLQLNRESELSFECKEDDIRPTSSATAATTSANNRTKVEKKTVVDKPIRNTHTHTVYDKPKRMRRVRAPDKSSDKVERPSSRATNKIEYEDEDEPMEEEDDVEYKPTKEVKRKERDTKTNSREKEKEKEVATTKDDKDDKKDYKKSDAKKDKSLLGTKINKKANSKQVNSKLKKKKKTKEKEIIQEDMPVDPDEPTYCICNRISYGDMIGCDNTECKIEWFHFECVNLTHKPKGKWYCPRCTTERKEKGRK